MMWWNTFLMALVVLTNLVLAALVYGTVGWHFIRGYNEVGNFLVAPAVAVLAGANLVPAALMFLVGWWRRRRSVLIAVLLSASLVLLSLLFAPAVGRVAKRNLWIKTPLVEAARYGDAELVIILVERGPNPNSRQASLGTTPLHYMVAGGETEAVKVLLERGADPNARANTSLETPLHWAFYYRANLPTLRTLVQYGADCTLQDWKGKTPTDYADVIPEPERTQMLSVFGNPPPRFIECPHQPTD